MIEGLGVVGADEVMYIGFARIQTVCWKLNHMRLDAPNGSGQRSAEVYAIFSSSALYR